MLGLHVNDIDSMSDNEVFLELYSNSLSAQESVIAGLTDTQRRGIRSRLALKRSYDLDDELRRKFGDE